MSKPVTLHVVGSINVDFVIRTKTLPRAGETIGHGAFSTVPGGKGANQACAARRLGADVYFSACVGDDGFDDVALANLRAAGAHLQGVARKPGVATGAAFINVADDGENQIAVASGANAAFAPDDLQPVSADAIITQLETPETVAWAAVKDNETFFCLNTAPAIPIKSDLLRRADLLVMNETEHAFYSHQLDGFEGLIAQTYGGEGAALFRDGKKLAEAKPPRIEVVDTTGAGDTFTAALTVALVEGQDMEAAVRFACAAGAAATTKLGAQSGMPTREEVERLLR